MTKRELKRIRDLYFEIKSLQAEISDLEVGVQSPSLEDKGSTPSRNIKSSVELRAIRLSEIRTHKEEKDVEFETLKLELERFLKTNNDEWLNTILRYRFVQCYAWKNIAYRMHTSSDALRQYYARKVQD